MNTPPNTPEDATLSPLEMAAAAMHEQFLAFISAGFTEYQALTLVSANIRHPEAS